MEGESPYREAQILKITNANNHFVPPEDIRHSGLPFPFPFVSSSPSLLEVQKDVDSELRT